jgi:hypothetical protein
VRSVVDVLVRQVDLRRLVLGNAADACLRVEVTPDELEQTLIEEWCGVEPGLRQEQRLFSGTAGAC